MGNFFWLHSFYSSFLGWYYLILDYSMQARVPKFITNNTTLPFLCAFMDDLSLMSSTVSGAQTFHSHCITTLSWAGLDIKADKSHSIVIANGRPMNTTHFSVSKTSDHSEVPFSIPSSIHSGPFKFLGRISVIDKSHFAGTQKL